MCGRFALYLTQETIEEYFSFKSEIPISANYNVAPSQNIYCIKSSEDDLQLANMQWGFIPHWADLAKLKSKPINARIETVSEKPFFRQAYVHNRCIVLANGYYEWQMVLSSHIIFILHRRNFCCLLPSGLSM